MAARMLRGGFHMEGEFQGHRNPIRYACYDPKSRIYLSLDSKCFKMWRVGEELATLEFASVHDGYIAAVHYVEKHGVFLAAALDNTLKIFDQPRKSRVRFLPIVASMIWDQAAVTAMVFNPVLDELITASSQGISVWRCDYSHDERGNITFDSGGRGFVDKLMRTSSTQVRTNVVSPWKFGKGTTLKRRLTLNLRLPAGHNASASAPQWVSFLELQIVSQRLFASTSGYILGFDAGTGARIYTWSSLHSQPVTCMLYLPDLRFMVTGSSDCTAKIWLLRPGGVPEMQATLGSPHTKAMVAVKEYAAGVALLTASADGAVMLWSLHTFEPLQRMKIMDTLTALHMTSPSEFLAIAPFRVLVFRLAHVHDAFTPLDSTPVSLSLQRNAPLFSASAMSMAVHRAGSTPAKVVSLQALLGTFRAMGTGALRAAVAAGAVPNEESPLPPPTQGASDVPTPQGPSLETALGAASLPPRSALRRTTVPEPGTRVPESRTRVPDSGTTVPDESRTRVPDSASPAAAGSGPVAARALAAPPPRAAHFAESPAIAAAKARRRRQPVDGPRQALLRSPLLLSVGEDSSIRLVSPITGEAVSTTASFLSAANLIQVEQSAALGRIFALLSDGEIHVYSTAYNPTEMVEKWAATRRDPPTHFQIFDAFRLWRGGRPGRKNVLIATGKDAELMGMMGEGLVCGTAEGDVIFLDVLRQGLMTRRFRVHRSIPVERVEMHVGREILATVAVTRVVELRVFDVKGLASRKEGEAPPLLHSIDFDHPVTCMSTMGDLLITGHRNGGVSVTNVVTGVMFDAPKTGDHLGAVQAIGVCPARQAFITCALDGHLKMFDPDKRLQLTLDMQKPMVACAFLNDDGDIVAGLGNKIVVIRASVYERPEDESDEEAKVFSSGDEAGDAVSDSGSEADNAAARERMRSPTPEALALIASGRFDRPAAQAAAAIPVKPRPVTAMTAAGEGEGDEEEEDDDGRPPDHLRMLRLWEALPKLKRRVKRKRKKRAAKGLDTLARSRDPAITYGVTELIWSAKITAKMDFVHS